MGHDGAARLLCEAHAAAALDHPNAVSTVDVCELDGTPFIVMDLVAGRTLRGEIGGAGVPSSTRVAWLADVARALAAAAPAGARAPRHQARERDDEADRAPLDAASVPPAVSAVVLLALSKRPEGLSR